MPATKDEASLFDEDVLTGSGENRFCVRVRVAFSMAVRAALGDEAIQDAFEIRGDVGVGVLIDGYTCSGMRNIDVANPVLHAGFGNEGLDFVGYVDKLCPAVRMDTQRLDFCHDAGNRSTRKQVGFTGSGQGNAC